MVAKPRRRFTVDALFADGRPQAVGVTELTSAKEIRLDRIDPDPDQPRRTFDGVKLGELADSIRREGILQPIAVRYDSEVDRYVILHGERRFRAAKLAGLSAVPAIVRDVPVERRLIQQLMENIVRDDLNAVDRAAALRALKSHLGDAPWEAVAEAVGIRRSRLFQLLGTEKLPGSARDDLRSGRLNEKQSRALHGLPPVHQEVLLEAILAEEISATEAMRLGKALRAARLPDDAATVAAELSRLRSSTSSSTRADEAEHLLRLVAKAAAGDRSARTELDAIERRQTFGPFSLDRLSEQLLALAQSLAAAPVAETRRGGSAHPSLTALAMALAAVLDEGR